MGKRELIGPFSRCWEYWLSGIKNVIFLMSLQNVTGRENLVLEKVKLRPIKKKFFGYQSSNVIQSCLATTPLL
jgi:hypothetical protein